MKFKALQTASAFRICCAISIHHYNHLTSIQNGHAVVLCCSVLFLFFRFKIVLQSHLKSISQEKEQITKAFRRNLFQFGRVETNVFVFEIMSVPFLFRSRSLRDTRRQPELLLDFKSCHFFHRSTLNGCHEEQRTVSTLNPVIKTISTCLGLRTLKKIQSPLPVA